MGEPDPNRNHNLALLSDGTVRAWGFNSHGQLGNGGTNNSPLPVHVEDIPTVTTIAAGSRHSLAIDRDGSVFAWGINDFGSVGDGTLTDRSTPVPVITTTSVTRLIAAPVLGFFSLAA